jgi:hypothetical protein
MTSWIITQTQRFKAASVGAGSRTSCPLGTADIPSFIPDYFDGEFGTTSSPGAGAPRCSTSRSEDAAPDQHGERTSGCPCRRATSCTTALKRRAAHEEVVYPRQPHGIQEPRLQLDSYKRNLEWFDRWVMGKTAVPPRTR